MLVAVPEALVAYSCDKNFGLYRDRVGALYVMMGDEGQLPAAMSNAHALARANWSQPPDHGAAAVRLILEDQALVTQWIDELDTMRTRIRQMREKLAAAGKAGSVDLTPMGHQNGMFSIVPLTKEQILEIRERHGVYMAGSGRITHSRLAACR